MLVLFKVVWNTQIASIWYVLWPFGNFVTIWYILPRLGILCQEKSGNPGLEAFPPQFPINLIFIKNEKNRK
jgi:hypothetical protein